MSQITLRRNSPSGIRLPSISTLAEQGNIRLPDMNSRPSPRSTNIESLPSLSSSLNMDAASTVASLVQLSQTGRSLPQPIISTPSHEKIRSKSDHSLYVKEHMTPTGPVRSQSYVQPNGTYGYNNTPPPPSRMYYASPPPQQQQQQYPQQQQQQSGMVSVFYPQNEMSMKQNSPTTSIRNKLSCQRCGTTETPEWRRGPNGARTLCNACGLYHAKLVKRKGALAAAEEMKFKKVHKPSRISRPKTIMNLSDNNTMNKYHSDLIQQQLQQDEFNNNNNNTQNQRIPYHIYQYEQNHQHLNQLPPLPPHQYSPRIQYQNHNFLSQQQQQQQQLSNRIPQPPQFVQNPINNNNYH